jgi:hypothetical protein
MRDLPKPVQRAPQFFYAAAILFFVASVVLTHLQLGNAVQGLDPGTADSMTRLTLLASWLQAAEGSIYLAAYGVLSHILLAIWRDRHDRSAPGADE